MKGRKERGSSAREMAGRVRGEVAGLRERAAGKKEKAFKGRAPGELDAYTGCTSTQTGSKLPCLSDEQNCMIECPTLCEIDRMPEGPTSSRDSDGVRVMFSHQTTPCPLDSPGIKANNADAQEPGHERRT